jgi:hypothetical protein
MADPWQKSQGSFRLWVPVVQSAALGYRFATGVALGTNGAARTLAGSRCSETWPPASLEHGAAGSGDPRQPPPSVGLCVPSGLTLPLPGGHGTPWTRRRCWRLSTAARLPRPTCGARASSSGHFVEPVISGHQGCVCGACNRVPVELVTIDRFEPGHPTAEFRTAPAPSQSAQRHQGQRHRGHPRSSRRFVNRVLPAPGVHGDDGPAHSRRRRAVAVKWPSPRP